MVEEVAGLARRYEAHADVHRGPGPVRYGLAEAPPRLTVDLDTGVARGTPPEAGQVRIVVEASVRSGEPSRQCRLLHILPGP